MKKLIVNGDDFGLSPGVNQGIVEAFHDGILTSTTAMTNMPGFHDAVETAREHPELPVGIHLTLLWGQPVTEPKLIPSLVDKRGNFPRSAANILVRNACGRLTGDEITLEFRNQIRKFLDAGLTPSHIDTHQHIHCLPLILDCIIAAASKFGIRTIRPPVDNSPLFPHSNKYPATPQLGRAEWTSLAMARLVVRMFSYHSRARLQNAHFKYVDRVIGMDCIGRLGTKRLCAMLGKLEPGTTELMCQPGHVDDELRAIARLAQTRETELQTLVDPRVKESIEKHDITLISYLDLDSGRNT